MDEEKKKTVMIAIIIVCLVLAAGIFILSRPDAGPNKGPVRMLCEECDATFKMGREEFKKALQATGKLSMMNPVPIPLKCIECGEEEAAYYACTCRQCKVIFIEDTTSGDYKDRCPECGYSAIEQRIENRRK